MNINHFFCVSGCGYLENVIVEQGKMMARIQVMPACDQNHPAKDAIWLDCEVPGMNEQHSLEQLSNSVQRGQSVFLAFKAEYDAFIDAYSGQTKEDPEHIVMLRGKLIELGVCYVNGALLEGKPSQQTALTS